MAGKAYVVLGATGTGKTSLVLQEFVNRLNDKRRLYVYDRQREYGVGFDSTFEEWLEKAPERQNSLIVIEEATINLSVHRDFQEIRELLVDKRHNNNVIILVFHTLARVPDSVIHLIDGWYMFPTHDNNKKVRTKYYENPSIYDGYLLTKYLQKGECLYVEKKSVYSD